VGQAPQVVVLTPLLPGVDGVEKMSKSLGNAIGIAEPPAQMYGKVMSIPDALMPVYFEFCTEVPLDEVRALTQGVADGSVHPRDAKRRLARAIVELWHGPQAAAAAEAAFDRVHVHREAPEAIPEVVLASRDAPGGRIRLTKLLVVSGLAESNNEARRLVSQGGVTVDGTRIHDIHATVEVRDGVVVQVGPRRFARLRLAGA
jgi:tyrosyl-tRNA synthetase